MKGDRKRRKNFFKKGHEVKYRKTKSDPDEAAAMKKSPASSERILRARPSRHERGGDVELMMECEDDGLTPPQLLALKRAKDEYDKVMIQIKAAREGRLLFGQPAGQAVQPGKVTIMNTPSGGALVAQPEIIVLDGDSHAQKQVAAPVQAGRQIVIANRPGFPPQVVRFVSPPGQPAPTSAQLAQLAQLANQGSPGNRPMLQLLQPGNQRVPILQKSVMPNAIPVQRVPAQPRKPDMNINSQQQKNMEVISGTFGLGVKRTFGQEFVHQLQQQQSEFPPYKKQKRKDNVETDDQGNWVSLDEYYYGKREGDPGYTEERGEFRFKCWYCNKMLYNNIKTMVHIQSHIDSDKQQNLDLSDLTQCKHCYKQFDTPFEMQTHIEKVHLSNTNVLMCRICEKDHETRNALTNHMRQNHNSCEMPYICHLCNFRSSMYGDVVDHFKKKHDSSPHMLCLYCLKVVKVQFVSNGWGKTQNYYHHLVKHQGKVRSKKCSSCKLTFFSPQEVKVHKKKDHLPNQKGVLIGGINNSSASEQVMIKVSGYSNASNSVKSLNAPAVTKLLDLSRIRIPMYASNHHCYECKGSMANPDHFKKYTECSMCRFATSCSSAYANHMMSFHSGRAPVNIYLTIPVERPMEKRRYCLCGFNSRFGNKIANHMVFCMKKTCYNQRVENLPLFEESFEEKEVDPRRRPGASILDALGLVKKQTAKRSSDKVVGDMEASRIMELVSRQALLAQFEQESIAANEQQENANASEEEIMDFDIEEEVDSDDDRDTDYRPGRFSRPPKIPGGKNKRYIGGGAMLVKLNFNKTPKKSKVDEVIVYPSTVSASTGHLAAPSKSDKAEQKLSISSPSEILAGSDESNSASKDGVNDAADNKETGAETPVVDQSQAEDSTATGQSKDTAEADDKSEDAGVKMSEDLTTEKLDTVLNLDDNISDEDQLLKDRGDEKFKDNDKNVDEDDLSDDSEKNDEVVGREVTPENVTGDGAKENWETSDEKIPNDVLEEENVLKDGDTKDVDEEKLQEDVDEKGIGNSEEEKGIEISNVGAVEKRTEENEEEAEEIEEVPDKRDDSGEAVEEDSAEIVEDQNEAISGDKSPEVETPMEEENHPKESEILKPAAEEENPASPVTPTQDEAMETDEPPTSIPEDSSKGDYSATSPDENIQKFSVNEHNPEGVNELSALEEPIAALPGDPNVQEISSETSPKLEETGLVSDESAPQVGESCMKEAEQVPSGQSEMLTENPPSDLDRAKMTDLDLSKTGDLGDSEKQAPEGPSGEPDLIKRSRWDISGDAGRSSQEPSGDRSEERRSSGGSGSYDQRYRQSSGSYDKSPEKRYSGSHHRSHDRYSRDDKYNRDHGSGRYDDRGHSSRDYDRRDDRGYSSRDHGHRGDRYNDNRYPDDRHHNRGYRRDRDYQGRNGRGGNASSSGGGYYGNQRKDYH